MERYGVKCSRPIEIGKLSTAGYMLISYIEGNDAADELPRYAVNDQFKIGIDAGIELKKMHQYNAPKHVSSWYERKVNKHRRCMDQYMNCGVRVRNDDKIMAFIEQKN